MYTEMFLGKFESLKLKHYILYSPLTNRLNKCNMRKYHPKVTILIFWNC